MREEDRSEEALALEWRMFFVQNWAGIEFIKWLSARSSTDCLLSKPLSEIESARIKIQAQREVLAHINNTVSNLNKRKESKIENVSAHSGGHTISTGGDDPAITPDTTRSFNRWK